MSAGSDASNGGYGIMNPYGENINTAYINQWSSNNPANFSSNETQPTGLGGTYSNVAAAVGKYIPWRGSGGERRRKKSLTKRYRKMKKVKSRRKGSRKTRVRTHRRKRQHRGGYSQYQNNMPMTPTYSVGGIIPSSQLGLANPPPITTLPNCTNCIDNYNHFTGKGFPSAGH